MGRYSTGRVHCHYCWNEGHNVKTCDQLSKKVKEEVGGYYHRKYAKYFDEQGNRKQDNTTRSCSYCKNPGHTKRTCNTRLEDVVANVRTNADYRQKVWDWMKDKQVGVGSLVTIYNEMYLVTGINWDDFVCGNGDYNRKHLLLEPVSSGSYRSFIVEDDLIRGNSFYQRHFTVEDGTLPVRPNEQWFKGGHPWYETFATRNRVHNSLSDTW